MSSILTNTGAMVALQTMRGINTNLDRTQNEISTGKSVGNARDNAAVWAIAKTMDSDVSGLKAIGDSLSLAKSTVTVARVAAETTVELMNEMKELLVAGTGDNVDHAKIQADIEVLQGQIESVLDSAQFNGLNLVDGEASDVEFLSAIIRDDAGGLARAEISIDDADLDLKGDVEDALGWTIGDAEDAQDALDEFEAQYQIAIDRAATFGSTERRIDIQAEFNQNMMDALTQGIGGLVDADMEEASARLQSLQVQQQLATQSLSIANQQPQNILALFR